MTRAQPERPEADREPADAGAPAPVDAGAPDEDAAAEPAPTGTLAAPAGAEEPAAPSGTLAELAGPEEPVTPTALEEPPPAPRPRPLARLAGAVGRFADAAATRLVAFLRWAPLALAIAAAPTLFLWPVVRPSWSGALVDNGLELFDRIWILGGIVLSLIALGVAQGVTARRHRSAGPEAMRAAGRRLVDRLLWLLPLPLVPPIALTALERSRPFFVLFLAAAAAALAAVAVYRFPRRTGEAAAPGRLAAALPTVLLALGVAGYAAVFSVFSINQHHALATQIFDLGIYDNLFWRSAHGDPLASSLVRGGSHVSAHFDPILVLLSPLYLLAPRAETILVLQAAWLATGAIPLFLIARRHLGSPWAGLALAAAWWLHPALHGANLYDFHSLTLIAPLVPWAIHLADAGRTRAYAAVLLLLLLVREDVSLLCGFLGVALVLAGRRRLGLATVVASVLWLAFAKLVVMPDPGLLMGDSKESYSYAYYFRELIPRGTFTGGLVASIVGNPIYAAQVVLKEEKVLYFLRLFLPLLFLPFFAPRYRFVLLYGFAFLFLASKGAVYSLHFQYGTVLFPAAMALVPAAVARIRDGRWVAFAGMDGRRLAWALLAGLVTASALVSLEHGATLRDNTFRAGPMTFEGLRLTPEQRARHEVVRKAVAMIPPDAGVAATPHLVAHVSNRHDVSVFSSSSRAEYLFLDLKKLDGKGRRVQQGLRKSQEVEVLLEESDLVLLRRKTPVVGAGPDEAPDPRSPEEKGLIVPPTLRLPDLPPGSLARPPLPQRSGDGNRKSE